MTTQETIMGLIVHGGNARSLSLKALIKARNFEFKEAEQLIEKAGLELNEAHQVQTLLIQAESRGEETDISLLMVHAQDHLMNAMTVKDLAQEIILLNNKLQQIEGGKS